MKRLGKLLDFRNSTIKYIFTELSSLKRNILMGSVKIRLMLVLRMFLIFHPVMSLAVLVKLIL